MCFLACLRPGTSALGSATVSSIFPLQWDTFVRTPKCSKNWSARGDQVNRIKHWPLDFFTCNYSSFATRYKKNLLCTSIWKQCINHWLFHKGKMWIKKKNCWARSADPNRRKVRLGIDSRNRIGDQGRTQTVNKPQTKPKQTRRRFPLYGRWLARTGRWLIADSTLGSPNRSLSEKMAGKIWIREDIWRYLCSRPGQLVTLVTLPNTWSNEATPARGEGSDI